LDAKPHKQICRRRVFGLQKPYAAVWNPGNVQPRMGPANTARYAKRRLQWTPRPRLPTRKGPDQVCDVRRTQSSRQVVALPGPVAETGERIPVIANCHVVKVSRRRAWACPTVPSIRLRSASVTKHMGDGARQTQRAIEPQGFPRQRPRRRIVVSCIHGNQSKMMQAGGGDKLVSGRPREAQRLVRQRPRVDRVLLYACAEAAREHSSGDAALIVDRPKAGNAVIDEFSGSRKSPWVCASWPAPKSASARGAWMLCAPGSASRLRICIRASVA
jgi:hypothetical protein